MTAEAPARPADPRTGPVLEARNLTRHFVVKGRSWRQVTRKRAVHAVDDVSLSLASGRVVAVVGESGSGKSTVGRLLAQLDTPTSGDIVLRGTPVRGHGSRALRPYRREVQIVFQDPFASLNPIHTVGYHLSRPLQVHSLARGEEEISARVQSLLERVHLTPAAQFAGKLPHELSGGQRQRVAIARALAVEPSVLIADEPISMLDVSIRLSVLNLLAELTRRDGLAMLYITHDIASARYFADTVLVMYAGRVVEGGPAEEVTQAPAHPYTKLLLSAAPNPDVRARRRTAMGEPPSLIDPPSGCRFHPRCPVARQICAQQPPPPFEIGAERWSACWEHGDRAAPETVTRSDQS
jgi:peptide/nickel transport system ATP-binding protein